MDGCFGYRRPFCNFERCEACGNCDRSEFVEKDGFYVCPECGVVDARDRPYGDDAPEHFLLGCTVAHHQDYVPEAHRVVVNGVRCYEVRTDGVQSKGRYRPIFHWNERVAQFQGTDPALPDFVNDQIIAELQRNPGEYGPLDSFSRATVVRLLRKLELNSYRERWRSILYDLSKKERLLIPLEILRKAEAIHRKIEPLFQQSKDQMPASVSRVDGRVVEKKRHNVLPFNYEFRKIMESMDIYDFHFDLPLLRSPSKLRALDAITRPIFKKLGLKFVPTVIMKRPKIHKRRQQGQKKERRIQI